MCSGTSHYKSSDNFLCGGANYLHDAVVCSDAGGSRGVDGGNKAADLLHRHSVSGLLVVVEHGEDLHVQDLELADAVHHLLQALHKMQSVDMQSVSLYPDQSNISTNV